MHRNALVPALLALAIFACEAGGTAPGGLADGGDADADADSDSDVDTDADGDSDADGDADTDADSDSDSDADTDADADSDGDADTDADSDPPCVDEDEDWWCVPFDCDDGDPDVNPGVPEQSGNGVDDDCNGLTDETGGDGDTDTDGDSDTDADSDVDTDSQCIDDCTEASPVCQPAMASEDAQGLCDQLDNDCDGTVDEGCTCGVGQVQPCFIGPPNFRDVGQCTDGTQTCVAAGEFGVWGACTGGIWPTPEICDNVDNDCDGCTDDDLCCDPLIDCSGNLPDAQPFQAYVVDGTDFYTGGDATGWTWEMTPGPCYETNGNRTSFTMNGQSNVTQVSGPTMSTLTLFFTLSGQYTLTMTVQTPSGPLSCSWVIHVVGPGLRVELCWDTTTSTDIDIQLGKVGVTDNWFGYTDPTHDPCFAFNCASNWSGTSYTHVNWGYAPSPYSMCSDIPYGDWSYYGYCPNPRIDIDNNFNGPGVPENVNLDNPNDGDQFRVFVHYFSGTVVTHPVVNVYCEGILQATYGIVPQVAGFDTAGGWSYQGDGWKVVDIVAHVTGGVTTCDLYPILTVADDYWVETQYYYNFAWGTPPFP